jgi:hypothetical protein
MENFKRVEGTNTALYIKGFGTVAVFIKAQHQSVHSIIKEVFDPVDYYFTDTDDPTFVNESLQGVAWLEDIKRTVRAS